MCIEVGLNNTMVTDMKKKNSLRRNIIIFTGLSLGALHIINRFQTTSATSKPLSLSREDKSYDWRFGRISYKKRGKSSSLLLLHDLSTGSSKAEYKYIYEKLAENHTVYVPDFLGYGDSAKPELTYTAPLYEELMADFIKSVITTKTSIVATGDSAPIVLKLAHDNPELVEKVILINPLGLYDQNLIPSNQTKLMKAVIDLPVIGTYCYNLACTKKAIDILFREKYISDTESFDENRLDEITSSYFRASHIGGHAAKFAYACHLAKYTTCSILHELKEINNSIIILGGENEPDIKDNIENYIYYNSSIEFDIIPGTSHLPHIEKPEKVAEQIEVFLS